MLIRKRQYRNSQASIVEVGNRDEFPDFADLFFFFLAYIFLGSVSRSEAHIFFCLALSVRLSYFIQRLQKGVTLWRQVTKFIFYRGCKVKYCISFFSIKKLISKCSRSQVRIYPSVVYIADIICHFIIGNLLTR